MLYESIALGSLYFGTLFTAQLAGCLFREKIGSKTELDRIIKEEAEKRGLHARIYGSLTSKPFGAGKMNSDEYYINLTYPISRTRHVVRHEIDHIASGDCEKHPDFFYYWFIAEPRAIIYSHKGFNSL